jgi:hypothetical protein
MEVLVGVRHIDPAPRQHDDAASHRNGQQNNSGQGSHPSRPIVFGFYY